MANKKTFENGKPRDADPSEGEDEPEEPENGGE
jgi:hypothetical protein